MTTAVIETNVSDDELEGVLEKALASLRGLTDRPARRFDQPVLDLVATRMTKEFSTQVEAMIGQIEKALPK